MKKKSAILLSLAALALSIGAVGAIATGTDLLSATPVAVKAADEQAKTTTLTFSGATNSKSVSSYSNSWTATADDKTIFDIENFNNNKNAWSFIKCGNKGGASIASIQNSEALEKPVAQVKLTIDNVTAEKVNSINLIVSSDKDAKTVLETVRIDKISTGDHLFNVKSPAPRLFYKLEFDCQQGTSNGLVTVRKVVFTYAPESTEPAILVPNGQKVELSFDEEKSVDFSTANLPANATIEASSDNEDICVVGANKDLKKLDFLAGDISGETTYKVVAKNGDTELASFIGTITVVAPSINVENGSNVELEADETLELGITANHLPNDATIKAESANTDVADVEASADGKSLTILAYAAGTTTYTVDILRNGASIAATKFEGTITVNPKESKKQSVLFGSATGSFSLKEATPTFPDGLQTNWSFFSSGTTSFTQNAAYSQVGSKNNPAKQINLRGSFAKPYTVQSVALKVGGNSGTAGDISLKLDGKEIGTGELNASSDVIVKSSNAVAGFDLSVDISNIAKGVKIYSIEYVVLDNLTAEQEVSTFVADFITPKAGEPAEGDTCKVKYGEAKSAYDRMSAEAKGLFDNDEAYASSKATYDYWAAHIDSANGTKALPSNLAKTKEANNNGALIATVAILGTASLGLIFACKKKHSK